MNLMLAIQSVLCAATAWLASVAGVFALIALGARIVERKSQYETLAQFKRLGLFWQIVIVLSVGSATRWAGAKGDRGGGALPIEPHIVRGILIDGDGGQLRGETGYTPLSVTDTQAFSNLAFCAIAASSTNVALAATWNSITNRQETIDVYMRTNLVAGTWGHLAEVAIDTASQGVAFDVPAEWLDGAPVAFFRLGSRLDTDGDGLPDSLETLVYGSDPGLTDTDGDNLLDGDEVAIGTDPATADMDYDGLLDSQELSWHIAETNGLSRWVDISANVNKHVLFADNNDSVTNFALPFGMGLFECMASNLSVNVNGLVALSGQGDAIDSGHYSNHEATSIPVGTDPTATIAAFWDDLHVYPDMGSSVSFAAVGEAGSRTAIVEFNHVGFHDANTNNYVSFQVQFPELETNIVHVVFAEASGFGAGLSATLGMRTSRDESVEYSYDTDGAAFPGLAITYHIGFGTDPTVADSDGDGVYDGEEVAIGTNPVDTDTDGDEITDDEEMDLGTDPLAPDTDSDGLPDFWEVYNGFDPLDPADGSSDADDDGLTLAQEVLDLGTDPDCWDSDGDGLSDSDEITAKADPLDVDTDGDGLPDGFEVQFGTDPILPDSDRDRLPDGWEYFNAPFDPLDATDGAADADLDGLSNAVEILNSHTDMNLTDTDNDGLSDYLEWNGPTLQLNPDTDDDGLLDGQETALGTDPCDADSDDDGSLDGWEVRYGFNPLSASSPNPWADPDMDGIPNREEARLGTNPFSADTDGDGLADHAESSFISRGIATVFDLDEATNLLNAVSDMDDGALCIPLPFPVSFQDGAACTNLAISLNGHVNLSIEANGVPTTSPDPFAPLVIEAFHDDLKAFTNELGSALYAAEVDISGVRHFVVEYRNFGFFGLDALPANTVSFQIDFAENATNEVRVSYFQANAMTNAPSQRVLGINAALGAATPQTSLLYSLYEPYALPGLCLTYRFVEGTSPTIADMDDDGIPDGSETVIGTDPLNPDTDGDGLTDGEEQLLGINPLSPNSGDYTASADLDGDGLPNGQELLLGTDPGDTDTDDDGVSDGAEWINGTDPLDPNDTEARDTVEVTILFGDQSESHSEKYEATIRPVLGDPRPALRLVNRQFGAPDTITAHLVSNAFYEVTLRHIATNMEDGDPDLDYTFAITPSGASANLATIVIDPDKIIGTKDNRPSPSWFSGKKAKIAVVKARILADLNRDGAIDEADAALPGPLRMWVNDDHDLGAIADGESDVPGPLTTLPGKEFFNNKDRHANGISDLEDFFPVWLDIGVAIETLLNFDPEARLSVKSKSGNRSIGIVKTALTASTAGDYLRDVATAQSLSRASTQFIGGSTLLLSPEETSALASHSDEGVFLLEGLKGSEVPLRIELIYNETPALTLELPVRISPVEDFYRWVNLRGFAEGHLARPTNIEPPGNFPSEMHNGKNVVFVHGFNVTEREARGWHAEMFKRLWQSGCNAAYYAVTWRGDVGWPNGMFYHEDVHKAFLTAPFLASHLASLTGQTSILAHSLGNMVVSSAIQDHGYRPTQYFMLNAAVPAEAYDASAGTGWSSSNPLVHPDWYAYASRTWSARWHELFVSNDDRAKVTWRRRFANVADMTELFNFHSGTESAPGDQVLQIRDTPPSMLADLHYEFPFTIDKRHYSWHKQELGKGRLSSTNPLLAGTTWAGWGLFLARTWHESPSGNTGGYAYDPIPATIANAMTDAELQDNPIFLHSPSEMFSSTISSNTVAEILACGIPALSGPAGSRDLSVSQNYDINQEVPKANWPRSDQSTYGKRWLHSDIKNIAFPIIYRALSDLSQRIDGGL